MSVISCRFQSSDDSYRPHKSDGDYSDESSDEGTKNTDKLKTKKKKMTVRPMIQCDICDRLQSNISRHKWQVHNVRGGNQSTSLRTKGGTWSTYVRLPVAASLSPDYVTTSSGYMMSMIQISDGG